MAKIISIDVQTMCPNCGSTDNIELSDDRNYAKCMFCGAEYLGGEDELKEKMLECPEVKEQVEKVAIKHAREYAEEELAKALMKATKGFKGVKFTRK